MEHNLYIIYVYVLVQFRVQALQSVLWIRISLKADQDLSFLVDVDPDPIKGFDSRIVKLYS